MASNLGFKLLQTVLSHIDVDDLLTAIEQAERLGLVVPSSEGPQAPFQFSHELIRQTLLADASLPRRQLLHLRVADAIEKAYAEVMSENAVEIVNHLSQAGALVDGQRLVLHLETAGKNALEASAYEDALSHFQSALSHQGALAKRVELLVSLAMAERGLGRWNAALTHLDESLEITIGLGDPTAISRIFSELADALLSAGRYEEAAGVARRGLDRLQQDLSADRARLLCVVGRGGVATGAYEPAEEALREALTVASQLFDPNLVARVLGDRCVLNTHFFRLRDAVADGVESERVGGSKGAPWPRAFTLRALHLTLLFLGRLEEAARITDEAEPLARRIGQSSSISTFIQTRAWTEFGKAPDLARLEVELQEAWEVDRAAGLPIWISRAEAHLSELDFIRGSWDSALDHAQAACRREPRRPVASLAAGTLFRQLAYAGDRGGAFAILNDQRTRLPVAGQLNTIDSWATLLLAVEGLVILGEQQQAAQLYPLVRQLVDTGAVFYWSIPRSVQTIAGVAAAAARNWDAAEEHFQIAMRQAESFPHRLEIAEINRFHAAMLLDRDTSQDRERARGLLNAALDGYTRIGMPRHAEITRALLHRSNPA